MEVQHLTEFRNKIHQLMGLQAPPKTKNKKFQIILWGVDRYDVNMASEFELKIKSTNTLSVLDKK